MQRPSISVIVPCYNEQDCLNELQRRVTAVCRDVGQSYEIVLVDDGSRDQTWPMMRDLADADDHFVCVKLSRNHGHQLALTAGLSICRGERIFILDGDLQDPPELLPEMLKVMDEGADVVYGQRRSRKGENRFKLWTAAMFYKFINKLSESPIPVDTGDFRLISRRALEVLLAMPERHRFVRGMVSWIGFRQVAFPYDRAPRFAGETKYPLLKMLRLATDCIVSSSVKPLQLTTALAMASFLFGLLILLYVLISYLAGHIVSGWTSILGCIAIFSSVQLFVLSIMGMYLGRLYEQSRGRPLFIIETIANRDKGAKPD
jgi:polyisoprenyl-phosphate glycosyltransferase